MPGGYQGKIRAPPLAPAAQSNNQSRIGFLLVQSLFVVGRTSRGGRMGGRFYQADKQRLKGDFFFFFEG